MQITFYFSEVFRIFHIYYSIAALSLIKVNIKHTVKILINKLSNTDRSTLFIKHVQLFVKGLDYHTIINQTLEQNKKDLIAIFLTIFSLNNLK